MTKTSGRRIKCMACGHSYGGGKTGKPCPKCTGADKPEKDKGKGRRFAR